MGRARQVMEHVLEFVLCLLNPGREICYHPEGYYTGAKHGGDGHWGGGGHFAVENWHYSYTTLEVGLQGPKKKTTAQSEHTKTAISSQDTMKRFP